MFGKVAALIIFSAINLILSVSDQEKIPFLILSLQTPFLVLILTRLSNFKVPLKKFWLWFLLFLLINFHFSVDKPSSWQTVLTYFSAWLTFIIGHNLQLDKKLKKISLGFFLFICLLLAFPYLYFRFKPVEGVFSALTMILPISGHIHFSSLLLLAVIASFLTERLLLTIWFLLCLLLTDSVSSFSALLIITTLLSLNPFKFKFLEQKRFKNQLKIAAVFAFLVLAIFLTFSHFQPKFITQIDPVWNRKTIFGSRHWYWTQAIKGFLDKPVFGYGLGTFGLVSQKFQNQPPQYSLYAHNFYLQWIAETGLLGALVLIIISWQIIKNLNLKTRANQTVFLILLASTTESAFDYGWQFPSILLLIAFFSGIILKKANKDPAVSKSKFLFFCLIPVLISSCQVFSILSEKSGNYRLSLVFDPFNQEARLETYYQHPDRLTEYLFTGNIRFWNQLSAKYRDNGRTEKEILSKEKEVLLLSINGYPGRYLELAQTYLKDGTYQDKAISLILQMAGLPAELSREKEIVEIIRNLLQKESPSRVKTFFTKLNYYLGLFYLNQGQVEKAESLWQENVAGNPDWSYFQIELANLYWQSGRKEEAVYQLENICAGLDYPKWRCLEYLKEFQNTDFGPPGNMKEEIEKYFKEI